MFDLKKKRKVRHKGDLDDKISRVSIPPLENTNIQGIDGTCEEKENFWEEERKVLAKRSYSFIAYERHGPMMLKANVNDNGGNHIVNGMYGGISKVKKDYRNETN